MIAAQFCTQWMTVGSIIHRKFASLLMLGKGVNFTQATTMLGT